MTATAQASVTAHATGATHARRDTVARRVGRGPRRPSLVRRVPPSVPRSSIAQTVISDLPLSCPGAPALPTATTRTSCAPGLTCERTEHVFVHTIRTYVRGRKCTIEQVFAPQHTQRYTR
jgi:hypothetical protein